MKVTVLQRTGVRKTSDFTSRPFHSLSTSSTRPSITVLGAKGCRVKAGRGEKEEQRVSNPNVVALERVLQDVLLERPLQEDRYNWEEIGESWVLRPSASAPEAIVHFLGGAFIGVAPQLAYRQFLEAVADRNILVIATPFSTHFDHLRSAEESHYKFEQTMERLNSEVPNLSELPVYGLGHSLGALLHLLISSKYAIQRDGNILISFNNKPATEVVPLLSQIAPAARFLSPLLMQAATSPFRPTAELIRDTFRDLSPSLVRQVTPIAEQFLPIYFDVAQGNQQFTPSPGETRNRVKSYYSVSRNLLVKFREDEIDETEVLASLIQECVAAGDLDLTIRALPGDHARPMQPTVVDLPPEVTRAATNAFKTSGSFINQLSQMAENAGQVQGSATLNRLSKGVSNMAEAFDKDSSTVFKTRIESLADEISTWIQKTKPRQLPDPNRRQNEQQM